MNLNQPRPEVALSGLTTSDAQDQNLNPSSTHSRLPVAQKELAGEKPQKPQLSEAENWNWPEPVSLKEKPVPIPFPVDSLPEVVKAAVLEVQSYTQAPLSIAVASALSSLSLAAQGQVNVAIDDHMIRPVSLFFLTIAESGERKSSTDRHFQQAIKEYEQQVSAASKVLQEDFDADLSIWEMKMGVLENQLKQNMKKGKLDSTELQEELKQLRKQRPKPPRSPRLLVNDISSEALVKQLSTWPTAGIFSAEAGYIFGSYALSNDKFMTFLTLLNQLWDGDPVSMDRKSVESMNLPNGRLTVNLLVQPQAFQDFQNKTFGMARGTGFLSRFLLSEPESTQGTRLYQIKKGMPSLGAYSRKIKEFLQMTLPINEDDLLQPVVMNLDSNAKEVWIAFHDQTEQRLTQYGEYSQIRDVASKAAENMARMACLFSYLEGKSMVAQMSCQRAIQVIEWYLDEANRLLGDTANSLKDHAEKLEKWLIVQSATGSQSTSMADIQKSGPNGLRSKEALQPVVELLEDHGRVQVFREGKGQYIVLNPKL